MDMKERCLNPNIQKFLEDDDFIKLMLPSTDELEAYWEEYLLLHPDLKDDFELARDEFRRLSFKLHKIPEDKREIAIAELVKRVKTNRRQRMIRGSYWIAEAFVGLLLIALFYTHFYNLNERDKSDYIVGDIKNSEEIISKIKENKKLSLNSKTLKTVKL